MAKNGKKTRKGILIIVATLILGGFALNWYLTHRLESFLRERLSAMVADATDGFYKFSFHKLSVGLFTGELTIEGLELLPDSATFSSWQKNDSLPSTYYHANIESIHFEGINLTWRHNYKNLDFSLLKIKNPTIEIFAPYNTSRFRKKEEVKKLKTLHEMISPYINVLRIKTIDLEHFSVSYTIEDPASPNLYTLKNANFKAYYFILDSNSHNSGKLLYCNNFEISADEPQTLMSNNVFTLKSEKIRLSTQDSLIEVGKTILAPQKGPKTNGKLQSDSYVDARLNKIEIKGINFTRKEAKSYLDAHSFSIEHPVIEYFSQKKNSIPRVGNTLKINPDSIWTLYSMISPILDRVSIDTINVKTARMKYTASSQKGDDVYALDNFNFEAYGFSVDSLSDNQHLFLYSKDFAINAINIQGQVASQNHIFDIGHISLDTRAGLLNIQNIRLNPIAKKASSDYIKGNIASINLNGMIYNQGVQAKLLTINQPQIEYYKGNGSSNHALKKTSSKNINIASIYPLFNHFSITDIAVKNANLSFLDQSTKDRCTLTNANLNISSFSINEKTLKESRYFFAYKDFSCDFKNLNAYLFHQTYHLTIENGSINTYDTNIRFENINLSSIEKLSESGHKSDSIYAYSPSINIEYSDIDSFLFGQNSLIIKKLDIDSPNLRFIKAKTNGQQLHKADRQKFTPSISIGSLNISSPSLEYIDLDSNDSLTVTLSAFQVKSVSGNTFQEFSVKDAALSNLKFHLKDKNEYNVITSQLNISDLNIDKKTLNIGCFNLFKPEIKLDLVANNKTGIPQPDSDTLQSKNLYTTLGKIKQKISIDSLNINDANVNYRLHDDHKDKEQRINNINFKLSGLNLDSEKETFALNDVIFNTKELEIPSRNEFYTYKIGYIDLNKKNATLQFNDIRMVANYSKMEFAYQHPQHKDWFDVSVGEVMLSGIEFPILFSNKTLNATHLAINDFTLQNFKNQKIDIQHNIMPMIYENLQALPFKLNIDSADVYNTNIVYEELSKNGTIPGKIFFTDMNGHISGLTNIETKDNRFITLNADGKLMGTGNFTATWQIPINRSHDQFLLKANLYDFDLKELNQLIKPMAPAEITSGKLKDVTFSIDASSLGASVDMRFLYNDLKFVILRDAENGTTYKLASQLANRIIKKNNPNKPKSRLRTVQMYVERDPYHSTFNYFWQILQPPLVESVGISEKKQNFLKKTSTFINNIKNIFRPKGKEMDGK